VDLTKAVRLPYGSNNLSIGFAGIHLGIPGKTYYQYRLNGFDKDWQKDEDIQWVRYTTLSPGTYAFELKASTDGVHWTEATQQLNIVIVPPLWMRWWAIAASALLFAAAIYLLLQIRNKKARKQKEELEAEEAVNYFASGMHEHQTVDAILWDVARACIGRLQFEDCVIYLVDEKRGVLVQKAAFGPKSPKWFEITEPIEIPVGKGIVGSVAASGKAELIGDTSKDTRYIVDDERRYSEISVPIIWGGNVIGVIDCEDRRKHYFTQKHLSILITIASLCANKIIRAKAEEEAQKTQAVLSDTQQKMAEAEMQALRAQMNPHFIFNCLNSINRYILKSDEATASLYLTRFAKLIRLILDNSGSKTVLLSNELEALKLYIEMEALRFDKKFSYSIKVDRAVNADSISLPPLIIQPYVENAIWHGLLHKEDEGCLSIDIKMADEGMLECMIDDNGIGRAKAKEVRSKSATHRKSLGMQLTEKRIALLNQQAQMNASITIIDKEDEAKMPTGTKVILHIPV
jgi:putative methionine-R-sulfoxide reductase with GAF domain